MKSFSNMANLVKTKRMEHPKRYTQTELSHLLGYKNGQFVSNIERGICGLPLKSIRRFCEILGAEPSEVKAAILLDLEVSLDTFINIEPNEFSEEPEVPKLHFA